MNKKQILAILFLSLVLAATVLVRPVLAEPTNPELEFLIVSARREINKQGAVVHSLRKRYENILKHKKALQQFIDEENKNFEEFNLAKGKSLAKPLKAAPVSQKRPVLRISGKASKKPPVLREEKERPARGKVMAAALKPEEGKKKIAPADFKDLQQAKKKEESLRLQISKQEAELLQKENKIKQLLLQEKSKKDLEEKKKNEAARIATEKKTKEAELKNKKQEQVKFLAEKKAKEQKAQEEAKNKAGAIKKQQQAELEKKKNEAARVAAEKKAKEQKVQEGIVKKQQQANFVKKQKKEEELLSKKLEKERLLAAQEQQRLISERECQMRLLLEADKSAKHERYVSQLGQLLNRQNFLLEETKKLESQINQEEETLKALEKTRQDLIKKLLENS
jgi:hypothetical protein